METDRYVFVEISSLSLIDEQILFAAKKKGPSRSLEDGVIRYSQPQDVSFSFFWRSLLHEGTEVNNKKGLIQLQAVQHAAKYSRCECIRCGEFAYVI